MVNIAATLKTILLVVFVDLYKPRFVNPIFILARRVALDPLALTGLVVRLEVVGRADLAGTEVVKAEFGRTGFVGLAGPREAQEKENPHSYIFYISI